MMTTIILGAILSVVLLQFSSVSGQICNTTESFCDVTDTSSGEFQLPTSAYGSRNSFQIEIKLDNSAAVAEFDLLCNSSERIKISLSETTAMATFLTEELASRSIAALNSSAIVLLRIVRDGGTVTVTRLDGQQEEQIMAFPDRCSDFETSGTTTDLDGMAIRGAATYYYYKDPCYYKPCKNGGICRSTYGYNYYCVCVDHAQGSNCEDGPEVLTTVSVCPGCHTSLKCSNDYNPAESGPPRIFIKSATYGRADVAEQQLAIRRQCDYYTYFNCAHDVTSGVREICQGNTYCTLYADYFRPYYSTCKGPQYLTIKYLCARRKIGPENAGAWMGCGPKKVVKVFKSTWNCNSANSDKPCCQPISTRREVKAKCDHHPSCDVSIHRNDFKHPCIPNYVTLGGMQMDIFYGCIKKKPVKEPKEPFFVFSNNFRQRPS